MVKCDFYDVFGVGKGVFVDEIKKVYCKKVKEYYLDCNVDNVEVVEVKFKEVNEVYEILKDVEKKVVYDCYGYVVFEGGMGGGGCGGYSGQGDFVSVFLDVFDDFFGDFMGGGGCGGGC